MLGTSQKHPNQPQKTMNDAPTIELPSPAAAPGDAGLQVALRREQGSDVLIRETVTDEDFSDAYTEAWRELFLRQGYLDVARAELPVRLLPIPTKEGDPSHCQGYALENTGPNGKGKNRCVFTMYSLAGAATRAGNRLVEQGVLQPGEQFFFELETARKPPQPAFDPFDDILGPTVKRSRVHYLQVALAPLLKDARAVNEPDKANFTAFYTEDALQKAEAFSRQGAKDDPDFESGAVLAGPICTCPDSGEFFVVVCDILEVTDADQTLVSLEYSPHSWAKIQTAVRARQQEAPALRILGQAHGHNFLPNEGKLCEECHSKEVCDVDNLFVSQDDKNWTKAVFSQQPWQLCHIFGLTARADRINALFGLHDARLLRRGFHVLPGFEPRDFPTLTATQ